MTDLNTATMRVQLLLAGFFLLVAVALASIPPIEIKVSISTLFGGFKQLTRSTQGSKFFYSNNGTQL